MAGGRDDSYNYTDTAWISHDDGKTWHVYSQRGTGFFGSTAIVELYAPYVAGGLGIKSVCQATKWDSVGALAAVQSHMLCSWNGYETVFGGGFRSLSDPDYGYRTSDPALYVFRVGGVAVEDGTFFEGLFGAGLSDCRNQGLEYNPEESWVLIAGVLRRRQAQDAWSVVAQDAGIRGRLTKTAYGRDHLWVFTEDGLYKYAKEKLR
jgi:hypothetical protein